MHATGNCHFLVSVSEQNGINVYWQGENMAGAGGLVSASAGQGVGGWGEKGQGKGEEGQKKKKKKPTTTAHFIEWRVARRHARRETQPCRARW
jgi:hypothetical protein